MRVDAHLLTGRQQVPVALALAPAYRLQALETLILGLKQWDGLEKASLFAEFQSSS